MTIRNIHDGLYQASIDFICHEDKDKVIKYLQKDFNEYYYDERFVNAGFCHWNGRGDYFICIPNTKKTWSVETIIAHECFHITSRILRKKGIDLCDESEEAFNYYLSWLIQKCIDIYYVKAKKMKPVLKPNKKASATKADLKKAVTLDKMSKKPMMNDAVKGKRKK